MASDGSVWLQNYYLVLSADNAIGSLQEINTLRDLRKPNAILGSKSVEAACTEYNGKRLTSTLSWDTWRAQTEASPVTYRMTGWNALHWVLHVCFSKHFDQQHIWLSSESCEWARPLDTFSGSYWLSCIGDFEDYLAFSCSNLMIFGNSLFELRLLIFIVIHIVIAS